MPKIEAVYDAGSSILMSSYGEATSECEINDSRFNDISCISYADRTIDEKDTSQNDIQSKETMIMTNSSPANHTINTSSSSKTSTDNSSNK